MRLISRPTHAMGQDEAETLIRMPMDINVRNSILTGGNHVITYNDVNRIFTLKG